MASSIVGYQAWSRNQTTVPDATSAITNCTARRRPRGAHAKAATPRAVSGCQANWRFSTGASIISDQRLYRNHRALSRGFIALNRVAFNATRDGANRAHLFAAD